jgi:hypothetical protein
MERLRPQDEIIIEHGLGFISEGSSDPGGEGSLHTHQHTVSDRVCAALESPATHCSHRLPGALH